MYKTIITCPVCDAILDVITHPDENGSAISILATDGRRMHTKESPKCVADPLWACGWNSETIKVEDH